MSDSIIIIDVYLNNDRRTTFLSETLDKFKKLKLPILLISNSVIPIDIQSKVDYIFYNKKNILFTENYDKYNELYYWFGYDNFFYENYEYNKQPHGLSVLCNLTNSVNFVKNLGFKNFIHLEWDFLINDDEIKNLNEIIETFNSKSYKGCFIYMKKNNWGMPEFPFHFWIADINFWLKYFPEIKNEQDYKNFIFKKNNNLNFENAERTLYLSFKDVLNELYIIDENIFSKKIMQKSKFNCFMTDASMNECNSNDVFRGLSKPHFKSKIQNKLIVATWNRNNKNKIITKYTIEFDNKKIELKHETELNNLLFDEIADFDFSKFPIKLKIDSDFEKIYYSENDIKSDFTIK